MPFEQVIRALQRDGWVVVRQKGSHVRLQKHTVTETLKLTVPAHRPIKRSTLSHILKQARIDIADFINLSGMKKRPITYFFRGHQSHFRGDWGQPLISKVNSALKGLAVRF